MYITSQMEICLGVRESASSLMFSIHVHFALSFPDHNLRAWNALYSNIEVINQSIKFISLFLPSFFTFVGL